MTREIAKELVWSAERADHDPEGVSVLVASRDALMVQTAAPRLAHSLYPGRRFGRVLHHEPVETPPWATGVAREWSEAVVEVLP